MGRRASTPLFSLFRDVGIKGEENQHTRGRRDAGGVVRELQWQDCHFVCGRNLLALRIEQCGTTRDQVRSFAQDLDGGIGHVFSLC